MKKLYFKYGVMGCSKSAQALMTAFNYKEKGYSVLLMKPSIDTRGHDKENPMIISRIGLKESCQVFGRNTNLVNFYKSFGSPQIVIVDEVQFCTKKQIEQLKTLSEDDVVVICYGLKTNFKSELFEGSKRLIELAESLQEIKTVCRCGAKATMNARIVDGYVVTEGKEIQIGGDESYEGMCYSCYKKYQKQPLER